MAVSNCCQVGASIFAYVGTLHQCSGSFGQQLRTITHTQDGQFAQNTGKVRVRSSGFMNTAGTTTENYPFYCRVTNELLGFAERVDLAIHIELTHPACDELGVLGPMIEDQNGFWQNSDSCACATKGAKSNIDGMLPNPDPERRSGIMGSIVLIHRSFISFALPGGQMAKAYVFSIVDRETDHRSMDVVSCTVITRALRRNKLRSMVTIP